MKARTLLRWAKAISAVAVLGTLLVASWAIIIFEQAALGYLVAVLGTLCATIYGFTIKSPVAVIEDEEPKQPTVKMEIQDEE